MTLRPAMLRLAAALRAGVLASLLLPALAWAGGTARLQAVDQDGKQVSATVEYAGSSLRAASPQQPNAYLLARGGKVYNVANVNGKTVVMDAADMMRMAGTLMPSPTVAIEQVRAVRALDPTSRRETVAGIAGTVYTLSYEDGRGNPRTEELVLARDTRANEFTAATVQLGRTLASVTGTRIPAGAEQLLTRIVDEGQGLLRFGNRFALISIDGATPPSSRFELPAGSLQVPDLGNLLQGLGR
ncbi:hypothetical protein GCM10023144_40190 [Pigmentiphaga soli]|uniref:DUF4412 domain-containing protein n=1 Tax=Pigmentiphaga soli TaxID=1007095 RepID=A0ABP8HK57_9BURK